MSIFEKRNIKTGNIMKRSLSVVFAAVVLLFAACNQKEQEAQMAAARHTQDSLQAIIDAKDGEINSLFDALNEIEDALTTISSKYGAVKEMKRDNPEASYNVKVEISQQLSSLDQMLSENKRKVAYLNEKIKAYGKENGAIQEFVAKLEERISEQERQIAELTAEIESNKAVIKELNKNVSDLTAENAAKDRTIAAHIADANRAYYIVGKYDRLKEEGVLQKAGGFLGMGRKQMLNGDLPTQLFKKIDITTTTTIQVDMKDAIVVSSHPESSYEMVPAEGNPKITDYLRILDPVLFWQNTRYLVISTK